MDEEIVRLMRCPFCSFRAETRSIGRVHCGPHKLETGYHPAVIMGEVAELRTRRDSTPRPLEAIEPVKGE